MNRTRIDSRLSLASVRLLAAFCLLGLLARVARSQVVGGIAVNPPPGVYLDPDGTVRRREVDDKELNLMRARAKASAEAAKNEKLAFVSLPKVMAQAKALRDAGKDVPDDLLYLGGLTQIRYLLVFPDEKDLVVAGPWEPVAVVNPMHAVGKKTGRPVMRLEDFVVAMRTVQANGGGLFGCGLDPDPASVTKAEDAMARMARGSRAERMKAMADAIGPQKVRIFGTAADSRLAFACVAADYELKRYGLGLARPPIPGIGHGVDNSRSAANKFWFELKYDPIVVSTDGNAYGLKGPRLGVGAGGFDFDPRGATDKAVAFAKRMNQNVEALSAAEPLFADLQNVADLGVVSTLILRDRLDQKIGWDTSWVRNESAFPVTKVPTPKNAETLVSATGGSIAAGGVMLSPAKVVSAQREKDAKDTLAGAREQAAKLRQAAGGSERPVMAVP